MYINMYIYICICVYIHMCVYTSCIYIYVYICICVYVHMCVYKYGNAHTSATYGVASVSRIDKIIGLFCKRAL